MACLMDVTKLLEAGLRPNSGPLILSPVLFQCHTASEPTLGILLCARLLPFPQSHLWSFQGMGTNHSFPARCLRVFPDLHLLPCALPASRVLPRPPLGQSLF